MFIYGCLTKIRSPLTRSQNRVRQKGHSVQFRLTLFFRTCVSKEVNESEVKEVRFDKIIRRLTASLGEIVSFFVFFFDSQC